MFACIHYILKSRWEHPLQYAFTLQMYILKSRWEHARICMYTPCRTSGQGITYLKEIEKKSDGARVIVQKNLNKDEQGKNKTFLLAGESLIYQAEVIHVLSILESARICAVLVDGDKYSAWKVVDYWTGALLITHTLRAPWRQTCPRTTRRSPFSSYLLMYVRRDALSKHRMKILNAPPRRFGVATPCPTH